MAWKPSPPPPTPHTSFPSFFKHNHFVFLPGANFQTEERALERFVQTGGIDQTRKVLKTTGFISRCPMDFILNILTDFHEGPRTEHLHVLPPGQQDIKETRGRGASHKSGFHTFFKSGSLKTLGPRKVCTWLKNGMVIFKKGRKAKAV